MDISNLFYQSVANCYEWHADCLVHKFVHLLNKFGIQSLSYLFRIKHDFKFQEWSYHVIMYYNSFLSNAAYKKLMSKSIREGNGTVKSFMHIVVSS